MKKILIVEDDLNLGTTLTDALEMQGFKVLYLPTDEGVISKFKTFQPDIVILDVMLNGKLDGFEIAKLIRDENNTPILFTTSCDGQEDFQKGFSVNNSDYVRKPYRLVEILLRLEKLMSTPKLIDRDTEPFLLGNFSFFPNEQALKYECEKIHLNKIETAVLDILCKNTNVFISRKEIVMAVWSEHDPLCKEGSLNNIISNLRKYLQQDNRIILESRVGMGVRLLFK